MQRFKDAFSAYIPLDHQVIADAEIRQVKINKSARTMDIALSFGALVPGNIIAETEKLLCGSQLKLSRVKIFPKFSAELFDVSYFPELVEALKAEQPSVNGTLNDASLEKIGDRTLSVSKSGKMWYM